MMKLGDTIASLIAKRDLEQPYHAYSMVTEALVLRDKLKTQFESTIGNRACAKPFILKHLNS